ncbi:FbpB family small basic protein [Bacillus vallismortis]|nr:FbpB family small basic protein [Bacillus vallismortis]
MKNKRKRSIHELVKDKTKELMTNTENLHQQ